MKPESTPERALVNRVRPIVVQMSKDVQRSMRWSGSGIEVTYRDSAWCDVIAAFAAEYAREQVASYAKKVDDPARAHLHYAGCPYKPFAELPSWDTPENAPACTCAEEHLGAYWKGQHLLQRAYYEQELTALRAENDRLTARYVALKEDSDADAEKLSQALSDAGDAIAERNQARHALRESQEEITRLTLAASEAQSQAESWRLGLGQANDKLLELQTAASESARTLQVELERLKAAQGADWRKFLQLRDENEQIRALGNALADSKNQVTALREALAGCLEWFNSKPVKDTWATMATLSAAGHYLALPVTEDFGAWAKAIWEQALAALPQDGA